MSSMTNSEFNETRRGVGGGVHGGDHPNWASPEDREWFEEGWREREGGAGSGSQGGGHRGGGGHGHGPGGPGGASGARGASGAEGAGLERDVRLGPGAGMDGRGGDYEGVDVGSVGGGRNGGKSDYSQVGGARDWKRRGTYWGSRSQERAGDLRQMKRTNSTYIRPETDHIPPGERGVQVPTRAPDPNDWR